jgi:hypothetical protein
MPYNASVSAKWTVAIRILRSIGGRSPAEYMPILAHKAEVSEARIDEIVATHDINPTHLRNADFDAYFAERSEALLALISEAMGKEAVREEGAVDGAEDEFLEEGDDLEDPADDLAEAS